MVPDTTGTYRAGKHRATGRMFAMTPVGAILPGVARAAFRKYSPLSVTLMADWPLIVGPGLAARTLPRRLASGTLTLGCTGPVALELQHLATTLIERMNQHLGRVAVTRLRFVQEPPPRSESMPKRRPRLGPISIGNFPEGALRDALSSLAAAIRSDRA